MPNSMQDVRRAYRAQKPRFWSKECKKICGLFGAARWSHTVDRCLREIRSTQQKYGYLPSFNKTSEMWQSFVSRLIGSLYIAGYITDVEKEQLLRVVTDEALLPELNNDYAKGVIFKACLEIGRIRPFGCALTIDHLMDKPINNPLPEWVSITNTLASKGQPNRSVEFHLAVSNSYGDHEYNSAVVKLSIEYGTLDAAHQELSKKVEFEDYERYFLERYEEYSRSIFY